MGGERERLGVGGRQLKAEWGWEERPAPLVHYLPDSCSLLIQRADRPSPSLGWGRGQGGDLGTQFLSQLLGGRVQ